MRAGHGGTTDGVGGVVASNPRGCNRDSRCKDVNTGTVVGEVGASIGAVCGTNGEGLVLTRVVC